MVDVAFTVTVHDALTLLKSSEVAVIVVVPADLAVTLPFLSTIAIPVLEEDHVTDLTLALSGATVADKFGNFYCAKATKNFNYVMASAANHTIIAPEKLVEIGAVDPDIFAVSGTLVDTIVEGEKPWQI